MNIKTQLIKVWNNNWNSMVLDISIVKPRVLEYEIGQVYCSIAMHNLDKEVITKEINRILSACRRNQCSCDIVLKDISTLGHNPNNIFMWEKTVMELVRNY